MIVGKGNLNGLGVLGEVFLRIGTESAAAAYGTREVMEAIRATEGKFGMSI